MKVQIILEDTKLIPDDVVGFGASVREFIGDWIHRDQYKDVEVVVRVSE